MLLSLRLHNTALDCSHTVMDVIEVPILGRKSLFRSLVCHKTTTLY